MTIVSCRKEKKPACCGVPTSCAFAGLFLLILLLQCAGRAHAVWSYTATLNELVLNFHTASSPNIALELLNPNAQFNSKLDKDPSVIPGSCVGSSDNDYGWNFWAKRLVSQVKVGTLKVTIVLIPQKGFSPTSAELVTCNIGLVSANYDGQISDADKYVQFRIDSTTSNINMQVVEYSNQFRPFRAQRAAPGQLAPNPTENIVRRDGIFFNILINGDVFNTSLVDYIVSTITCSSPDVAGCQWFLTAVKNKSFYAVDKENTPELISFRVPHSYTRTFNIQKSLVVTLSAPGSVTPTMAFGLKSFFTIIRDNSFLVESYLGDEFRVYIVPFKRSASRVGNRTFVLKTTENCIRGRNTSEDCPYSFWLTVDEGKTVNERLPEPVLIAFTSVPLGLLDMQQIGFRSPSNGFLSFVTALTTYSSLTGLPTPFLPTANYDMYINVSALPSYQIDTAEVITLYVPFSCMSSGLLNGVEGATGEGPTNVLSIEVTPSNGDLIGQVMNISVNDMWNGGVVMYFHMGGERWVEDVLVNLTSYAKGTLFDKTSGTYVYDPNQQGWEKWKDTLLPPGSVTFLNEGTTKPVNKSVIVLKFESVPQYVSGADEIVIFNFPYQNVSFSGLPFAIVSNMQFNIKFMDGTFSIAGLQPLYSIDSIGEIVFTITLQGGELFTTDKEACVTSMKLSWTSTAAQTALDPTGWSNVDTRNGVLPDSAVTYSTTRFGGLAIATFRFVQYNGYATRKGENISLPVIPAACLASGNPVRSNMTYTILIMPRRMTISMRFLSDEVNETMLVTQTTMRNGNFYIALDAANDTFDTSNPNLANMILDSFETTSVQPLGFAKYRTRFISNLTMKVNLTTVLIYIASTVEFVISALEEIRIKVRPSWSASGQDAIGSNSLNFTIIPSAGFITVDNVSGWYGASQDVTENDIRLGKLWFTFTLIGDQWIQQRTPNIKIFRSADKSPTGFINLVEQLVPSLSFFNFTTNGAFQLFTLQLQANDNYDIYRDEIVYISFGSASVSSGISPKVIIQNELRKCNATLLLNISDAFPFCIRAIAGRAVLSGNTETMDEKLVRRGGATIYITLFGEQWDPVNLSTCVRDGIRFEKDKTHDLYETTSIPSSGSTINLIKPSVISISMAQCTEYSLQGFSTADRIVITVPPACVRSRIGLFPAVLSVPILQTPGEMYILKMIPSVVTEETIRTKNVTLNISLSGDAWNEANFKYAPSNTTISNTSQVLSLLSLLFLEGFSSTSSPINEPNGFAVNRNRILFNITGVGSPYYDNNSKWVTLVFFPCPQYAIKASEIISLTILDPSFVLSGALPNPAFISFTIESVPTFLTALYAPTSGQVDERVFANSITSTLSLPTPAGVFVQQNGKIGSAFSMRIHFLVTPTEFDSRTTVQLTALFLSLQPAYLSSSMQILCLRVEDNTNADCGDSDGGNTSGNATSTLATEPAPAIFFAGCFVFIVVLLVLDYVRQTFRQGSLPGGNRPVLQEKNPYKILPEDLARQKAGALASSQQQRPATLKQYYHRHRIRGTVEKTDGIPTTTFLDDDDDGPSNIIPIETIYHRRVNHLALDVEEDRMRNVELMRRARGYRNTNSLVDCMMDTL